jgi:hypothetical protein
MLTYVLTVIMRIVKLYAFCVTAHVIADDMNTYDCDIFTSIKEIGKYMLRETFGIGKKEV